MLLQVGKMEYDGDPIAAPIHGGVEHARSSSAKRFPSEYAEGGFVAWQAHATSVQSGLAIDVSFPHIPWNKHVQLTNSMPILEWQSWAAADFLVTTRGPVRIACAGVHSFSVNRVGVPWYAGDIYRTGLFWTTLSLEEGVHTIFAKVKAKVSTNLRCQVHAVGAAEHMQVTPPQWLPDVVAAEFVGQGVPLIPNP